ncbi:MAG: ABC transporter ATP-binding protein [Bacteroidetes bacterium]|nr:ABC transporter ATP-binding protein [Bacteroidota bacterium]
MDFLQVNRLGARISFTLQKGQKLAIAGETGSGKSTLLKAIAGLVQPEEGEVRFEGKRVLGPLERLVAGEPGIAYLSQHFELWHNYRVSEVLSYANDLSEEDAADLYAICQIDHLLARRTDQLSGGERQRIALARLLVKPPRLLLLDEPFSNLDLIHKDVLKAVIRDLGEKFDLTYMLVSHDPLDLMGWADELLVLRHGGVVQQGTPEQVYRKPVDEYVAGLLGRYNVINGKFVRPEDIQLVSRGGIQGKVETVVFQGSYYELGVRVGGDLFTVRTGRNGVSEGGTVFLELGAGAAY